MHNPTTLLPLPLLLLTAPALSAPTTTPPQKRYTENIPWQIHNLTIRTPSPSTNASASVTFAFSDTNPGLELQTHCSHTSAPSYNATVLDSEDYFLCGNDTVAFKFTGTELGVRRAYIDPS